MNDRQRVIAWLTAHPTAGYKRAAKELDLDLATVTAWGQEHRQSGSANPRAREPAPTFADLSRLEQLQWQLNEAHRDLSEMQRQLAEGTGSASALPIMHRQVRDLGADYAEEKARAAEGPPAEAALTDEELLDTLVEAVRGLPPHHIERIEEVVAGLRRPRLEVVRQ